MKQFNDWLANKMSDWLSQMWFFWILSFVILSTLLFQRPANIQGWTLFFVAEFFQGVALVVINYTSKKEGRQTNQKLDDIHEWMKESHEQLHKKLDRK